MLEQEFPIAEVLIRELITKGIKSISSIFELELKKIHGEAKKKLGKEEFEFFIENYDLEVSEDVVIRQINNNLQSAFIWANEVNFSTALASKELNKIFVDIDLFLAPLKTRFDVDEEMDKINSKDLLSNFTRNKIIYGGAGAGKTTLIKKLYGEYLETNQEFDFSFPLVIRFREIDYENRSHPETLNLYRIIIETLGIQIKMPKQNWDDFHIEYLQLHKKTVLSFFNNCNVLLIADGFDEIPNEKIKQRIEKEFEELSLNLKNSRFILTSRSNDFLLKLQNTDTYEICPLSDGQIELLINKWIKNKRKADDLFVKIKTSPFYDTTMRPLTLSHLCAIYERRKSIPPKPRYIYDFVLQLLLEEWDQQRSVIRPSQYANFYVEKKKEFLAHLSFWLTYHMGKNVFNDEDIRKCYKNIHKTHNLPVSQAKKVVKEIENHTGIFIQSGYNSFQFSHKSLQEFLCAKYLSALPTIPEIDLIRKLPNEMAILVSLSSDPNIYFETLYLNAHEFGDHFWSQFLYRLIDEQPDFSESAWVIIFFLMFLKEEKSEIFEQAFIRLLNTTNLKIGFKAFNQLYKSNGVFDKYVSYLYKNLKVPKVSRNYPTKIHIRRDVFNLISNYSQ